MAHQPEPAVSRPDIDIETDVNQVFSIYPPLRHDRSRIEVTIQDGNVTVSGYTRNQQTRDVLERELQKVDGVRAIDLSRLYDDETLRLEVGRLTPFGVYASVSYGAVVLTGSVPDGMTAQAVVEQVEKMEAVRKVIPNFRA